LKVNRLSHSPECTMNIIIPFVYYILMLDTDNKTHFKMMQC